MKIELLYFYTPKNELFTNFGIQPSKDEIEKKLNKWKFATSRSIWIFTPKKLSQKSTLL